jgi:hypothetical protein
MREIQAVGGILRADFLGLGWDQLALLPFTPTLEAKGALAAIGVTDGTKLWAYDSCVAVRVCVPVRNEGNASH